MATYKKKNGEEIIAAIEHRKYPIVGVQFHPEKILFEHKKKVNVQLTRYSARASQELSRVIFDMALDNKNHFKSRSELEKLEFKNFNNKKSLTVFETLYLFKRSEFSYKELHSPVGLKKED